MTSRDEDLPQDWVRVATTEEVVEGHGTVVEIDGHCVALFRLTGDVFAIDNACGHDGGPLGEGKLIGEWAVCPWHGWRYSVKSGACELMSGAAVRTYGVRESDGGIWIKR